MFGAYPAEGRGQHVVAPQKRHRVDQVGRESQTTQEAPRHPRADLGVGEETLVTLRNGLRLAGVMQQQPQRQHQVGLLAVGEGGEGVLPDVAFRVIVLGVRDRRHRRQLRPPTRHDAALVQ